MDDPTDMPADWWPGDLQISGSHFGIGAQIEIPRHADGRIDMDKFNSTVICVRLTVWQLLQKKKSEEAK